MTAIVVPRDGQTLTEDDVIDFAKSKLAHYKAPKKVIFRSDIPYTATGKKQKFKLRAPFWTGERQVN